MTSPDPISVPAEAMLSLESGGGFDVILRNYQTWLVCGGRDFTDAAMFNSAMGDLLRLRGWPDLIVHGGARGADALAGTWARDKGIHVHPEPAEWDKHGKAAGPIRNQKMLELFDVHFVVAFPGGRGTADMIDRARKAGIDVAEIKPKEFLP